VGLALAANVLDFVRDEGGIGLRSVPSWFSPAARRPSPVPESEREIQAGCSSTGTRHTGIVDPRIGSATCAAIAALQIVWRAAADPRRRANDAAAATSITTAPFTALSINTASTALCCVVASTKGVIAPPFSPGR
jgi:hypothetical protein